MRLWGLAAIVVLVLTTFACGQVSSPVERQEQQERYVALRAELRANLPTIERLGLRSPRQVLGEA